MSGERVVVHLGEICPYLGIADDPAVRCLGASSYHRCHSDARPRLIGTSYQTDFCLSGIHRECPRWDGSDENDSVVEGVGYLFGWDGRAIRRGVAEFGRYLGTGLMGLAWMALAVAAMVLLAPLLTAANPSARAGAITARDLSANDARAAMAAVERPEAAVSPDLQPMESPSTSQAVSQDVTPYEAAAAPAPAPEPAPSPAGGAAPAVQDAPSSPAGQGKTYVVQSKDTLWSLARAHGVTVDDIMKANGLSNRDYIRAGQTIIIPQVERQP